MWRGGLRRFCLLVGFSWLWLGFGCRLFALVGCVDLIDLLDLEFNLCVVMITDLMWLPGWLLLGVVLYVCCVVYLICELS